MIFKIIHAICRYRIILRRSRYCLETRTTISPTYQKRYKDKGHSPDLWKARHPTSDTLQCSYGIRRNADGLTTAGELCIHLSGSVNTAS